MTTPYDTALSALNPTGWWKLADSVGSTTAVDSTGHGWTLTGTGAYAFQWEGPFVNYGLTDTSCFTDSSSFFSTTSLPVANSPTNMSLVAWYFDDGATFNPGTIYPIAGVQDTVPTNAFYISNIAATAVVNGVPMQSVITTTPDPTQWHMIAGTFSVSGGSITMSLYLDGELYAQQTQALSTFTFNSHGSVTTKLGGVASPLLAQCAVWTGTTLTAAQVQMLYQTGLPSTVLTPKTFNISLGGRPYMVDLNQPFYRQLRRQLEPLIRTQADTSNLPGEQSMDPNGLWRRSFEDWRGGSNQRYLDRNTSQDNSYWQSKGIDTLTTAWQISLLPDTIQTRSSSNTNLEILWAAGFLYLIDGSSVYSTPISSVTPGATLTWTAVASTPGVNISSATTDGENIYIAVGASGVYIIPSGGSASQLVTSAIDSAAVIGYCNGRLMLGSTNNLYNITSSSPAALPTALQVWGNTNARVTCFATGNNWLYVGLNVGGVGYIYGVQTTADGTTLNPPSVQGQLPNGEKIYSLYGYLGFLVAGTGLGVRVCQQGSTGVTLGTLIPTTAQVNCLFAYGSFVWFGWTDYDGTSTGLGKISLENFVVANLLPAYASDRMTSLQAAVTGVVNVNGTVLFAVSGHGFYLDSSDVVASGTIDSGYILYDLTDPKVPALLDVQGAATQTLGSYEAYISYDAGSFVAVGSAPAGSLITNTFSINGGQCSRAEVRLQLFQDSNITSRGPVLTRWTLRSYPAPLRPRTWQLPIVLDEAIVNRTGQSHGFDPEVEVLALEAMANTGEVVVFQEGSQSYDVFVTDFQFIARQTTTDGHYYNGLALVNIQSIPSTGGS